MASYPAMLTTLAAAQAEAGNFSEAAAISRRVREQALARGQHDLAAKAQQFANLYAAGHCYREKL